jgi:ubiquinone/menaquinone biosynthesis C-methylase UbiE
MVKANMMDKFREQWEKLGTDDPYWAVLADPDKRGGKWDNVEFFDTGKKEIANVLRKTSTLGIKLNRGIALDFGCGLGRLSRALANEFGKVIALDVSSSMLKEAQRINHDITNIEFIHNAAEDLRGISENSIDFLYSNIVLQHMPKNRQMRYIREFCRVLSSGGILAIQTPSNCNLKSWKGWLYLIAGNNILNIIRRIKYGPNGIMEVHALSKKLVLQTLNQEDMSIIHVERYDSAGPAFKSYMYFAGKS